MATQTDIPPYLTADNIAYILDGLDTSFNPLILSSLTNGIYTGIFAVTLWNIFMNKSRPIRRATIIVLVLLYILTSVNYAFNWSRIRSAFIDNSQNIWTKYLRLEGGDITTVWGASITSLVCTILVDYTIIWRCWMVWGQRYLFVLLPSLCLCCAIVFKSIDLYDEVANTGGDEWRGAALYAAFVLITTLWCTLLIIFRILAFGRASRASGGVGALYSVALILYLVFYARSDWAAYYIDSLTGIIRGIAPTVLIGRVAAGHARPDDTLEASITSSLRFGEDQAMQHSQDDSMTSTIPDGDLEAQVERDSEEEPTTEQIGSREAQPETENGDEDWNTIHVVARQ